MSDPSRVARNDKTVQPRIWRSRQNRVLAGVLGGLAEKLDVNPTTLRWFVAFAGVMTGFMPAFLVYCILWGITDVRSGPLDAKRATPYL